MKGAFIFSLLLYFNIMSLYAHREKTYYLFGKIGETEVAIQLDEYGTDCTARYITKKDKYDSILEGEILENGQFNLYSKHWDKDKKTTIIDDSVYLIEKEKNIWSGTWKYKDGKEVNFVLTPILIEALNHPYTSAIKKHVITPFNAYRTQDVYFTDIKKEKISKGIYIKHTIDPISKISFFRVLNNPKKNIIADTINDKLVAIHLNMINEKYSCVYAVSKGNYTSNFEVHFLNPQLISFSINTHQACYGDQGEDSTEHETFKMIDAKKIILEDLYWFGNKPQPELQKGEYEWFQYRYKEFGPKILALLTELYPEKITPQKPIECNYNDVKLWEFPEWYFTPKGLYLKYQSQTNKKCDDSTWSVIPYEKLNGFTTMEFGLIK
ncbi:hypothetical protein VP395_11235 [Mariniflexile soesokkakense]|uniref:YARHG domain-containing protein n=1 Tax=Mariniflexile soesokkakense TaxID=1343160 RepID=A0ABV0AEB8_9FLAO